MKWMSYDLAFWYESGTVTSEEAERKYESFTEEQTGVASVDSALNLFYERMMSAYPNLAEENAATSPWSSPVYRTDECVITTISWSRHEEVRDALLKLASERGITCFDPQSHTVHTPQGAQVTLERSDGIHISNPSSEEVRSAIALLSDRVWYAVLEYKFGWFVQAGYGEDAGVPSAEFALEYRDGMDVPICRTITREREQVLQAFLETLQGRYSWRERLSWSQVR